MLTANPITLRPYQEEALAALWRFWQEGRGHHPLIVLPTGAGKSPTMGELCRRAMEYPGTRICVLAHRGELVGQNAMAIEAQTGQQVGVYSAGLGSRETQFQVTVASIQSIYKRAPDLDPFDLIIIDECHRITPGEGTRYQRFLREAALQNPHIKYIGLTATPFRMGHGRLDEGEGALFDEIVYEAEIADLIRDGYLSEVVSVGGAKKIDTSGVRIRGGEFVAGELARAADDADVTRSAVAEIVRLGQDRKGWLIFASGVDHAHHILEEVRRYGIPSDMVTGDTPAGERQWTIQQFKSQQLRCLVSVEVFLEGFNAPHVDLIGALRPTQSPVLYLQAVGRGLRLAPGKEDCLLIDFSGWVETHGPIDLVRPKWKKNSDEVGEAPARECPECRRLVGISVLTCPGCGHEWPPPETKEKLHRKAYGGAVLSHQRTQELVEVAHMRLSRWEPRDPSRPATLLVSYSVGSGGLREVREWLCPEHPKGSYARRMFEHRCRSEWKIDPPATIADALAIADQIPQPAALLVRPNEDNPKWLDIVRRLYPLPEAQDE